MSKWLSRIQNRKFRAREISGDKVDIASDKSTVSTMSPHAMRAYENKSIGIYAQEIELRELILSCNRVYGGYEKEWAEYADDAIRNWSHDLHSAIECFNHLHGENSTAISLSHKELLV